MKLFVLASKRLSLPPAFPTISTSSAETHPTPARLQHVKDTFVHMHKVWRPCLFKSLCNTHTITTDINPGLQGAEGTNHNVAHASRCVQRSCELNYAALRVSRVSCVNPASQSRR
jgi:hypothetical protein